MVYTKEDDVLSRLRNQSDYEGVNIAAEREVIFKRISSHPWQLFTALDYDGTPIVRTKDEKDPDNPFKPYPHHHEYLYHMVHTLMDPEIMMLIIEKNRQIMASYTSLMVAWWKILNLPAQNVFVSRIKQETSIKLLKDKVRHTHILLPDWVKDRWKLTAEPKHILTAVSTGSCITGVPQTFANAESRGDSASEIIVDECAYQDHLASIITSALSMARRITLISTPNGQKIGGQIMHKYIKRAKDNAIRIDNPCEGLNIIRAKASDSDATLCVFEVVHRNAEQSKKSWLYLNESSRKQENELSWDHTDGTAYFPEVDVYGGAAVYTEPCTELNVNLPIERGFDFGVMRPAAVWAQVDPVNVRIHVVRAIIGKDIDPWSFAALVRYLSGEISREELAQHVPAIHALNEIETLGMPPTPWFNKGFTFRNWGGHEAARPIASGPGQKIQTYAEIFNNYGIGLNPMWVPKERREFILRHLLKPRKENNRPSILVDAVGAPLVLDGLAGGLVRPYNLKANEIKTEEPMNDHLYKDVYDALGYILVGCFSHIDWDGVQTSTKALVRESDPTGTPYYGKRLPRWGDSPYVRKPLVSFRRW